MWWRLSSNIQNWFTCWLATQTTLLTQWAGEPSPVPLQRSHPKLLTVRYRDGRRLSVFTESLGVVEHARNYESQFDIHKKLRPDDVVIDIGAHVGAFCLSLARDGVHVYAYEPDPDNFTLLEWNRRLNGSEKVRCFNVAISDSEGTADFQCHTASMCGSLTKVDFGWAQNDTPSQRVRTILLANVFAEHHLDKVALLKVDCEGSEYDILFAAGARDVLTRCHYILMEVHPVPHHDQNDMFKFLTDLGFALTTFENSGTGCVELFGINKGIAV